MVIQKKPPLHLTYCLNIHRGETWAENFSAIREKAVAVRDRIACGRPFGLGLRLGHRAARTLQSPYELDKLCGFLEIKKLYPFTINGFPYGRFHAGRVKEKVYRPDWRSVRRCNYTHALALILANLLPVGVSGSISTVPCSFKPWIRTAADVRLMAGNLIDCAMKLARIHDLAGKEIHLGLEPEPGCYLETTDETVRFFNETLLPLGRKKLRAGIGCSAEQAEELLRRHIGVCFDTCHTALQFEDLADSLRRYTAEGIRISKIQISAALRASCDEASLQALRPFCEPVYLHQVKARRDSGRIQSWNDLPEALDDLPRRKGIGEMRVHFHVPLFFKKRGPLSSTASTLTPEFFALVRKGVTEHLEIETYTFDVLPEKLRTDDVTQSIAEEFDWLLPKVIGD